MTRRWNILRNGEFVAVMTASEIRQALRTGRVEALDQATEEGSTARKLVVEFDEIFQEDTHAGAMVVGPETPNLPIEEVVESQPTPKKIVKRYFLMSKQNKKLGPLSSKEIIGLYSKGAIGKSVVVARVGSDQKISIKKFVKAYGVKKSAKMKRMVARKERQNVDSNSISISSIEAIKTNTLSHIKRSPSLPPVVMMAIVALLGGAIGVMAVILLPSLGGETGSFLDKVRRRVPRAAPQKLYLGEKEQQGLPENADYLAAKAGKTILTVPVRYSQKALSRCKKTCYLRFSGVEDGKRVTFTGVFNKIALFQAISEKKRVRLLGRVKKGKSGYYLHVKGTK